MFIVFVYEIVLDWLHSVFNTLKNKMMPARRKPQEFTEVCHVELQQNHHYSRVNRAVATSKLKMPSWFLYEDGRSLLMLSKSTMTHSCHSSIHILALF